jgi:transcriptional regulator with XRE-family HTH domain
VFVKVEERELARRLRAEDGLAIKVIAKRIGVSVGSVSRWVRDIDLTEDQEAALRAGNPIFNRQVSGTTRASELARGRRLEAQAHGRSRAANADSLHQIGCMLYWAEGAKRRHHVTFTNSDADMVALFVRFLRRCYGVSDDSVALSVNVHLGNGLALGEIERFWLDRLELPSSCLRQAIVNNTSSASKRKRRTLIYGTARVCVYSTFIVQSIFGAIQAYAGVDRSEWLDMP